MRFSLGLPLLLAALLPGGADAAWRDCPVERYASSARVRNLEYKEDAVARVEKVTKAIDEVRFTRSRLA